MLRNTGLDILVCPLCKGKLVYEMDKQELICRLDKLAYPIIKDIPMMLVESARKLEEH
ncbi:MAG: Trm112 family protein [Gammaproteobacteria bacterium]|nr:Trm112 family protein [Gammaproteobacteria bacterium]